jgi:hypothetical protein
LNSQIIVFKNIIADSDGTLELLELQNLSMILHSISSINKYRGGDRIHPEIEVAECTISDTERKASRES